MKYLPQIAASLLGLTFVVFGLLVLLNLVPIPELPKGSPEAMFMGAFGPTGYLTFVKVFEVLGGILVAIPRTRNFGLLILGPIIVNILAYNVFIMKGVGLFKPPIVPIIALLAAYLLWNGRKEFRGLLR
jgi:putative oxidoreductase